MKSLKRYQIISIIFTFILGTLLHFTYNWSNKNQIVAIFSSVNESTWEHLKLLFFPMLITTIYGWFLFRKEYTNFLCSKTLGIVIAMTFTVVFFYTYTGIIGKNIAFIDISSFFIAVIIGEVMAYLLIVNKFHCNSFIAIMVLSIIIVCFIVFTYFPPNIGLFKDPLDSEVTNLLNCN